MAKPKRPRSPLPPVADPVVQAPPAPVLAPVLPPVLAPVHARPVQAPFARQFDALLALNHRNIEALAAANRVALAGAQAVARRNMQIMQQTVSDAASSMQRLISDDPPPDLFAQQADRLKSAYHNAVASLEEINGLLCRSNGEALGVLHRRAAAALDEMTALSEKPEPSDP